MKLLFTTLFLLIITISNAQKVGAGVSMDFTGGFDFQETSLYKLKYQSDGGLSNNINIGLFARRFIGKYTITLGGNVGMLNFLYKDQEYTRSYCDVEITDGQYKSGVKDQTFTQNLYGSYNPYYSKLYTTEYEANSYVAQRNVYINATYAISESINIGTGLNIGFRKEVITVMQRNSTLESASGFGSDISVYDSYTLPVDRIVLNTINIKVPIIIEFNLKNFMSFYISGNIGSDYTAAFGVKWDISVIRQLNKKYYNK
jgi:hypothetical protein